MFKDFEIKADTYEAAEKKALESIDQYGGGEMVYLNNDDVEHNGWRPRDFSTMNQV